MTKSNANWQISLLCMHDMTGNSNSGDTYCRAGVAEEIGGGTIWDREREVASREEATSRGIVFHVQLYTVY